MSVCGVRVPARWNALPAFHQSRLLFSTLCGVLTSSDSFARVRKHIFYDPKKSMLRICAFAECPLLRGMSSVKVSGRACGEEEGRGRKRGWGFVWLNNDLDLSIMSEIHLQSDDEKTDQYANWANIQHSDPQRKDQRGSLMTRLR